MNEVQEMKKIIQMNKATETVYNLAETLNQSIMDREDTSEYYRSILQAIYTHTGKKQCHEFTGVVSRIVKRNKKRSTIYVLNLFWQDVYVSHHVVLTTMDDCDLKRGDYIRFKSIINEYDDGSNFGLQDFKLISKISEFVNLGCPDCERYKDVRDILCDMSYEKKHKIYRTLNSDSRSKNIQKGVVAEDFYNISILSLYYRQLTEMSLHKRVVEQVPPPEDIIQLIRIQLFVKYLQEEKKVTNPSQIIFCIVQFVFDETSVWINDIARRNGLNRNEMQVNNNNVILYLKNNETFYLSNHMNEFNKYCSTLDVLKN